MRTLLTTAAILLMGVAPAIAQTKPYRGAEVYTHAQHQYGRIEMRMRAARGSGVLSTFFTYKTGSETAGSFWEEIDVEIFGKADATTWQSNIIVGDPRTTTEQVHRAGVSLADGYHTYAVEWTPTSVVWHLDGVEVRRISGPPAQQLTNPAGLRFNLWASASAAWAGPFDPTALPQHQYVNWIRYYRYEAGQFTLSWTDPFDTFDTTRWGKATWTFDDNLVDFAPTNATVRDGTLILCLTAASQPGCNEAAPSDTDPEGTGGRGGSPAGQGGAAAGGTTNDGGCLCATGGGRMDPSAALAVSALLASILRVRRGRG